MAPKKEAAETAEKPAEKRNTAKKTAPKKAAPKKTAPRKKKPAGDTPAGYIRELVADAGAEGIMLSTITDAVRAKFKDFKVRDLGYSQMRSTWPRWEITIWRRAAAISASASRNRGCSWKP